MRMCWVNVRVPDDWELPNVHKRGVQCRDCVRGSMVSIRLLSGVMGHVRRRVQVNGAALGLYRIKEVVTV